MDTKWKVVIITLVAGFIGMQLQPNSPVGAMIWPPYEGMAEPTGAQLPLLIAVSIIEALAFGLGIAFLAYGWKRVTSTPGVSKGLATAGAIAITWGLVSWVPHTSMHISNAHDDLGRLIVIEYMFHVTLVIAAGVIALFAYRAATGGDGAALAMPASGDAAEPMTATP